MSDSEEMSNSDLEDQTLAWVNDMGERYVNDELDPQLVAIIREHDPERFAVWEEARMYRYMMEFKEAYMNGTLEEEVLTRFRANPHMTQMLQDWERERQEMLADKNPSA